MKILFVQTSIKGHHIPYLYNLLKANDGACIVFSPHLIDCLCYKQYGYSYNLKTISGYVRWIFRIFKIAKEENVDCIHFTYGDILYRFFGLGIDVLNKYWKICVTFHSVRRSKLHDLSLRRIFRYVDIGVVHTNVLKETLREEVGIKNIRKIEYPIFEAIKVFSPLDLSYKLGIPHDKKVILSLGGTRYDKGLDILLQALKLLDNNFYLVIAGTKEYFGVREISEYTKTYKNNVMVCLKYLSEDEMLEYVSRADILVLPYRKCFNGASGPLTLGVMYEKIIVGPEEGSLGNIINNNHLGYTFTCENITELAKVIKTAITNEFLIDEKYLSYKEQLNPNYFIRQYRFLYQCIGGGVCEES